MKNFFKLINGSKRNISIFILIILEISLLTIAGISYGNKNLDKYIFGSSDLKNTNIFAIMIGDQDGNYTESTSNTFPGYEYFYNQEKSTCMDLSGKPIENSLLYNQDTKTASITISDTSSCYLYFDEWADESSMKGAFSTYLINSKELWQSGLEGDGYRYVGTGEYQCSYDSGNYIVTGGVAGCNGTVYDGEYNEVTLDSSGTKLKTSASNYICFGTIDKTECLNNTSKYMYRIIGVFPDENGEQHVKLIKFKQLNERAWNKDIPTDISWKDSDLYKGLNGDYFLTNTTYDYLQNNTWLNNIMVWPWATVTQVINEDYDGAFFEELSPKEFYSYELNKSNKVITVGNWASDNAKIGLMYASDYALSLGNTALSLSTSIYDNRKLLSTGWMHQYNNDISIGFDESLMSSYKAIFGVLDCESLGISSDGTINLNEVMAKQPYRPVFYLNSDVTYGSGTGTYSDPYILKN